LISTLQCHEQVPAAGRTAFKVGVGGCLPWAHIARTLINEASEISIGSVVNISCVDFDGLALAQSTLKESCFL